jgi:hypothetical protein
VIRLAESQVGDAMAIHHAQFKVADDDYRFRIIVCHISRKEDVGGTKR